MRVRLNTNGQGSLIHNKDIVPKISGLFDAVSISLNAANAVEYNKLCRPRDAQKAFDAVLDFARKAKKAIPDVCFTAVGAPDVDVEACRALAEDEMKASFRLREYVPQPKSEMQILGHMG